MEPLKWRNIHDLYTTDTSLIRTLCSVPSVSVLERFDCSYTQMCCKRYHIIFSKFSVKFKCKICVQKEVIHNFKNHILVTWQATNLLILKDGAGLKSQIAIILFNIWPTNRIRKNHSGAPARAKRAWDRAPYSWNMVNLFSLGCHVTDRAYVRTRLQIVRVG